jgi:CRP-like cAMP-binding protein
MDLIARQPIVLLAEADTFVSMDLSDTLEQAGYRVLGPFATASEALAAIEQESPTLAIVDVVLRDGDCTVLERALRQRGIPFLVHSGLQQDEPRALSFQGVPWLTKPASPEDVLVLADEMAFLPLTPKSDEAADPVPSVEPVESRGNPLVRKLEGFVALSEADRAILERISANPRVVGPRTDLVCEGDTPDGVFLVMEGIACRHKLRASGSRQIMAYLLPGDFCDLDVALLSTMDHSISTLSACKVVRIEPEAVAELLRHHPQLARAMRMSTLVDEATLREWLVNIGRRTALERIAHLFCELFVRLQAVGLTNDGSYDLRLTQFELADTTGLSNVHVNRSLQELRRRGLIEFKNGRLTILNLPRLRGIAEFKANYLHLGNRVAA